MKNKSKEFEQMQKMFKTINHIKYNKSNHSLHEQNDPKYNSSPGSAPSMPHNGESSREFDISGEKIAIYGTGDIEIADNEKAAFQASVDEFKQQVSDMVEFDKLKIQDESIEWSGKLIKYNLHFLYQLGSENGTFIKAEKSKVEPEMIDMLNHLNEYYKTFASKWSPIMLQRNKQNNDENSNRPV